MKVTARSTNTPPLSGAEAFGRLLAAVMAKKPELRVVEKRENEAKRNEGRRTRPPC